MKENNNQGWWDRWNFNVPSCQHIRTQEYFDHHIRGKVEIKECLDCGKQIKRELIR